MDNNQQENNFTKLINLCKNSYIKILLFLAMVFAALLFTKSFDVKIIGCDLGDMLVRKEYERKYSQQELYSNLKDFSLDGNIITSTSNDPWIYLDISDINVYTKYIKIDVDLLGKTETQAQFFYAVNPGEFSETNSVRQILKHGVNYVRIPGRIYSSLRLDLTDREFVSLSVNSIELTNRYVPSVFRVVLLIMINLAWCGIWFFVLFGSNILKNNIFIKEIYRLFIKIIYNNDTVNLYNKKYSSFKFYLKRILSIQNFIFFIILFFVYSFRAPADLLTPYLWAEDGQVLIQRAIDYGFSGLMLPSNASYWFLQHLLALVCYYILLLFSNISLLPQLMSIITKIIITLSILYFTSDRFEWILNGKRARFITCVFIVLLIPQNAYDFVTCDTSLPFGLLFPVFLIGLDLLCNSEIKIINLKQTIFISLLCLSTAAAPLIAVLCGLILIRWCIFYIRNYNIQLKELLRNKIFISQFIKYMIICAAAIIQSTLILTSGRISANINILNRIDTVIGYLPIFPYSDALFNNSLTFVFIGIWLWVIITKITKISKRIIIYCFSFNFLWLLYCSYASGTGFGSNLAGRFTLLSYQIITLLLFITIFKFIKIGNYLKKYIAIVLTLIFAVISFYTYKIDVIYAEVATYYKNYNNYFDKNGTERIYIPIGPWDPWHLYLPVNFVNKNISNDLTAEITEIYNYDAIGHKMSTWYISAHINGYLPEKIMISSDGIYYPAIRQNNFFIAKTREISNDTIEIIGESSNGTFHSITLINYGVER